jgi:sporulation protein YlmC with PRC-barrel domain
VEDFHFGARVVSADGHHIGSLNFMIVDGESFDVHSLVVKETHHFSGHHMAATALVEDDISIPIGAVSEVTHDLITLSITSAQARRTEPYLTYRYAPLQRGDGERLLVAEVGQTGYAPHLVEEAHKRLDELEIHHGENVMLGLTGRRLGTVEDLVLDEGELAAVVIRPAGFFTQDVLLQIRFLGRSDDLALFAHLTEADLARLQPFHPGAHS